MGLGVPCGPVLTTEQALSLDHTSHRKVTVTLGEYHGVGIPVKLQRTPGSIRLPPPHIGEHSEEVLNRFGLDNEEIAALIASGTVAKDRKSVGSGRSVSVRVDLGGARIIKK